MLEMRVYHRKTKLLSLKSDFLQDHCVSSPDLYYKLVELRKLHSREEHLWIPKFVNTSSGQKTEK